MSGVDADFYEDAPEALHEGTLKGVDLDKCEVLILQLPDHYTQEQIDRARHEVGRWLDQQEWNVQVMIVDKGIDVQPVNHLGSGTYKVVDNE